MITLPRGFQIPERADSSSDTWDAMEGNIRRTDSHNHDGINSVKVSSVSISYNTANLPSAGWTSVSNQPSTYRQALTLPFGKTFDNTSFTFRTSTGFVFYPTVNRLSNNSIEVVINDSSISATVTYI